MSKEVGLQIPAANSVTGTQIELDIALREGRRKLGSPESLSSALKTIPVRESVNNRINDLLVRNCRHS